MEYIDRTHKQLPHDLQFLDVHTSLLTVPHATESFSSSLHSDLVLSLPTEQESISPKIIHSGKKSRFHGKYPSIMHFLVPDAI